MTPDSHDETSLPREPATEDQSLRARALARYERCRDQFPEVHSESTSDHVRQTIHELRVHQIELQMQNEELRLAQLNLGESRSRFRDLYDNAPVGYCFITADGVIGDPNRTLADMLGFTQRELSGRKFTSLIDSDDQDVFYHLRRHIAESLQPQRCEVRMRKQDATRTWIELSVKVASVDGDAVALRVALTNIDARIHAEAARALLENQLRESQKLEAVGRLAGGIAHDFNNILTVILVNAEITDRLTKVASPTVIPFVKEIQKAAVRARELVSQILAFCRREPTDRQVVSLAEVIEESIGMLRATMSARFQLHFTSDNSVPKVLADHTQVEQVVINLATNAMQAMEGRTGNLRIHLDTIPFQAGTIAELALDRELWASVDSAVRIVFADDGPGMEPNVVERIFEPFFTTKPVNQGTGLGLAVVHGIVRAHDGQIFVKSTPGQGTTFTIYLPPAQEIHKSLVAKTEDDSHEVDPAESPPASSSAASSPVATLPVATLPVATLPRSPSSPTAHTDRSVVYVDDDSFVLNSIVRMLTEYGVLVHGYSDPAAALQFLLETSNQIEALVTDYNMPGISGLEFARQVHRIRPNLPVVVTSGYIDDALRSHADEAGVSALLPKPFSAADFLNLIRRVSQGQPKH